MRLALVAGVRKHLSKCSRSQVDFFHHAFPDYEQLPINKLRVGYDLIIRTLVKNEAEVAKRGPTT